MSNAALQISANGPMAGIAHTPGSTRIIAPETADSTISYTISMANNIVAAASIAVNGVTVASTSIPAQTTAGGILRFRDCVPCSRRYRDAAGGSILTARHATGDWL